MRKALGAVAKTIMGEDATRPGGLSKSFLAGNAATMLSSRSNGPTNRTSWSNQGGTSNALIARLSQNLASSFDRAPEDLEEALAEQGLSWGPPFPPGRPLDPFWGYKRPPRAWDYPIGTNVQIQPRSGRISFNTLESLWNVSEVAQVCLEPGTPIVTKRGVVPVAEVVVGDEVMTHRGRWRRVYNTMATPVGNRPTVQMRAGGLDAVTLTADHPVYTAHYEVDRGPRTMRSLTWEGAGGLTPQGAYRNTFQYDAATLPVMAPVGESLLDVKEWIGDGFHVDGGRIVRRGAGSGRFVPIPAQVPYSAALGRLLGWYLAEGSQDQGRTISFALGPHEEHIGKQLIADAEEVFGITGSIHKHAENRGRGYDVRICSSALTPLFHCGIARTKHLPAWAWGGGHEFLSAMLDAWAEGDGCTGQRYNYAERTSVVTASLDLAWHMRLVATSLGYKASIVRQRHLEGRTGVIRGRSFQSGPSSYRLEWSSEPRRLGRYSFEDDGLGGQVLTTAIKAVDPVEYAGLVYNLEVEEDHSYLTTGGLVHNCTKHLANDLRSLDFTFLPPAGTHEDVSADLEKAREFFAFPDKRRPFRAWLYTFLMDVLRYDAGTFYIRRNEAGYPVALEVISGTSILPMVDFYGRLPMDEADALAPPEGMFTGDIVPAFVQIIEGMPWVWLTADDLLYIPWNPFPDSQYGLAPLESVLISANTDLRFQMHFLGMFTEGTAPFGLMKAPPDLSDPAQIAEWQASWDALMAGDPDMLNRLRWVPAGTDFQAIRPNADNFDPEFPLFLMRRICSAFGVTPNDLGWTDQVNRASSATQVDVQWRVGTVPLLRHVEDIINLFISQHLKLRARIQFDKGQEIADRLSIAKMHQVLIDAGVESQDEVRMELGKPVNYARPTPRYVNSPRFGPVPLLAIESMAGKVDPDTFAPGKGQKLLDHPFVSIPGVGPVLGTPEYKASQESTASLQRSLLADATGKPKSKVGIGAAKPESPPPGPGAAPAAGSPPGAGDGGPAGDDAATKE
ncbi:MAG: phage portal protein, partial [Acidimicrobiales bacterium]